MNTAGLVPCSAFLVLRMRVLRAVAVPLLPSAFLFFLLRSWVATDGLVSRVLSKFITGSVAWPRSVLVYTLASSPSLGLRISAAGALDNGLQSRPLA